jgi:hypothetical protein
MSLKIYDDFEVWHPTFIGETIYLTHDFISEEREEISQCPSIETSRIVDGVPYKCVMPSIKVITHFERHPSKSSYILRGIHMVIF